MIFPPAAIAVAILINGTLLQSYNSAYLRAGRVEAPIAPYLTHVADHIGYAGGVMTLTRGKAQARIRTGIHDPKSLQALYVPIAAVLRGLGARVTFDAGRRVLEIQTRADAVVQTMPPYEPGRQSVPPTRVFTPEPVPTPRPLYTGSPRPRRTPIIRMTSRP